MNDKKRKTLIHITLLIVALSLYLFAMESIMTAKSHIKESSRNDSFDSLYAQLELLYKQASMSAKDVATYIESDLNEQNLDELKKEMDDNDNHSKILHDIIHNRARKVSLNNVNNFKNGIVVMTPNGILEDFNRERSISDPELSRSWESEIDSSYNPILKKSAIDKLINHSSEIIAMEDINHLSIQSNHVKIEEMTYKSLKKIYNEEGVDGFKNYQFMAPSYITETGDIFGQDDIVHGVKMYNHKLIIVQEFNLYDQLLVFYDTKISEFDSKASDIENEFEASLNFLYLLGIFYIAGCIALLFYSSEKYNSHIDNIIKEENSVTDGKKFGKKR